MTLALNPFTVNAGSKFILTTQVMEESVNDNRVYGETTASGTCFWDEKWTVTDKNGNVVSERIVDFSMSGDGSSSYELWAVCHECGMIEWIERTTCDTCEKASLVTKQVSEELRPYVQVEGPFLYAFSPLENNPFFIGEYAGEVLVYDSLEKAEAVHYPTTSFATFNEAVKAVVTGDGLYIDIVGIK